jgi:hypothetical protein
VCQRCSPARACASNPTAFGSKSAPPLAPDSEVVIDRLKLLAAAIGVRRSEIVVVEEKS